MSVLIATSAGALCGDWAKLAPLPDRAGFAGAFAGVSHGALLVGGGANFPDKKPWDGGTKAWYDRVFVLEKPDGTWRVAGKLPRPIGYGVSVAYRNQVICVGGGDAARNFANAFSLEWKDGRLVTTELPALPKPLANCCGALVGDTLYVAGGQEKPDARVTSKSVYRIDLSAAKPKWSEIPACPGSGRMLAVAAGCDRGFFLAGGVDLVAGPDGTSARKYLKDAYRYDTARGWTRIADLPHSVAAAPSPAPADDRGFFVLGGDDGSQVGVAPNKHRGFANAMLRYDVKADKWLACGEMAFPRVTTPCAAWGRSWVVPSGEIRPGVRSPDVIAFTPAGKE